MKISAKKKFEKFKEGMKSVSSSEGAMFRLELLFVGTLISMACMAGGVPFGASVAPLAFTSAVGTVWAALETAVKVKALAGNRQWRGECQRRFKRAGVAVAGLAITGAFALVAVKSSSAVVKEFKKNNPQQENNKEPLSGLRKCNPIFDDCRRTFIAKAGEDSGLNSLKKHKTVNKIKI